MKFRTILCLLALTSHLPASAATEVQPEPMTDKYSQKLLLKNWAMSVCLTQIAPDEAAQRDASRTAAAYLEYSHAGLDDFAPLRDLANRYAALKYEGSTQGSYKTMQCIDLYNSKALETLADKLSRKIHQEDRKWGVKSP